MWQPPERIKHGYPEPGWPTAEQAARSRLFSPVGIGPLTAAQRTWVPAMVPWRATEDGFVTQNVIDWYSRFAQGKPGVIVVEATGIRDIPSGPLLRIGHDRFVEGLTELTTAVADASEGQTLLFIQIIDFLTIRRRPTKEKYFGRYLAITSRHRDQLAELTGRDWARASEDDVRAALLELDDAGHAAVLDERELESLQYGYRESVNDLHLPHIRELPQVLPDLFADAAARAFASGFHGVELHYAHAYTMASFLSRRNMRDDGYGGSRDNRLRLPLEVIARVRQRIGADRVLGCRFLGDEVIESGSDVDDACHYAVALAEAGLDFLSLSKGGKFEDAKQPKVGWAAYPYTGQSGYECMPTVFSDQRGPFGRNVNLAAAVREAVRAVKRDVPVVAAGGIGTFELAEGILQRQEADIVAAARQTLADPDWWLKMKLGLGDQVRRCKFTNYCEALDQKHKAVTCQLWDKLDRDAPGVQLDASGKRRLVAPPWRPE